MSLISFRLTSVQLLIVTVASFTILEVYIGIDDCVLSLCRELLSDSSQRVVIDWAPRDLVPIVSGVPQGSVLGRLLFILCIYF